MRALLFAAGRGTRLRPITDTLPKAMVDVGGEPLLARWLRALFEGGVERVLVNTHYLPDIVRGFAAASPWSSHTDLVHEPVLLGTGGTMLANRAWCGESPIMAVHADNASEIDVAALISAHANRPPGVIATIALFETDRPSSCGIVEVDERSIVTAFHEKASDPPGNLANAAVFVFEHEVFDLLAACAGPVIDLSAEIAPQLIGRMQGFMIKGYHRDIGDPQSLALARGHFSRIHVNNAAPKEEV
jgi:mannose-1-phosphate guanylyltransferase